MNISLAVDKSFGGEGLSRGEAIGVLNLPDSNLQELVAGVYKIRRLHKGDVVSVQILSNARSGDCTQNCAYCAQSHVSEANISKYRITDYEPLLKTGQIAKENGLARHCIGLSGIRFTDEEVNEFADMVTELKSDVGLPICCSIGFLTEAQARKLKAAGVDRINHNLNTGRNNYPNICTTHKYDERLNNIKMLQSIGFEICCGGIIGLGESADDIVDMLFDIRTINPQAVPINFLLPVKGTPLENASTEHLTPEYCLKILCLARLLMPKSDIRCTAGREVYLKGRDKELFSIVDSIFASGYLTEGGQGIDDTISSIKNAGFEYILE